MFIKKTVLMLLFLSFLLICSAACSEPLVLQEDMSGTVSFPLNKEESDSFLYSYSYAYPCVSSSDPSAELINQFYAYLVSDALDFEVPMMVDYYSSSDFNSDINVRISYTVTCNSDDYFSVLIRNEGNDYLTFTGHTFSRKDIKPGSSVALPYLLGILETDENDTWLQDRQTAKADELVRNLIWDMIEERREEMQIYPDFTREQLDLIFFPEEEFYLDETGNPVFYLEPGFAADQDKGLLLFPISLWEIQDEL